MALAEALPAVFPLHIGYTQRRWSGPLSRSAGYVSDRYEGKAMKRFLFFLLLVLCIGRVDLSAAGEVAEEDEERAAEKVALAREAYEQREPAFQAGTETAEFIYRLSRRWMEAELATLSEDSTERIQAIQQHLDRMTKMENRVQKIEAFRKESKMNSFTEEISFSALRYYVVEGKLLLKKAQSLRD